MALLGLLEDKVNINKIADLKNELKDLTKIILYNG